MKETGEKNEGGRERRETALLMGEYGEHTDLRLTEGGVNYGLWSLRKQKVAEQPGVCSP